MGMGESMLHPKFPVPVPVPNQRIHELLWEHGLAPGFDEKQTYTDRLHGVSKHLRPGQACGKGGVCESINFDDEGCMKCACPSTAILEMKWLGKGAVFVSL